MFLIARNIDNSDYLTVYNDKDNGKSSVYLYLKMTVIMRFL